MNTNEYAWVRLTKTGCTLLKNHYPNLRNPKPKPGDLVKFHFWELMNIFGEGMYMGNPESPFVDNEILFESPEKEKGILQKAFPKSKIEQGEDEEDNEIYYIDDGETFGLDYSPVRLIMQFEPKEKVWRVSQIFIQANDLSFEIENVDAMRYANPLAAFKGFKSVSLKTM